MIKFEKHELSAFTGKKINKFGQKAKILEKKMKMPMKSEKNNRFMFGREGYGFEIFWVHQSCLCERYTSPRFKTDGDAILY